MSMDQTIYLGPYFRCVVRAATREIATRRCVNTACKAHVTGYQGSPSGPFCVLCGGRIGDVTVSVPVQPDLPRLVNEQLHVVAGDECENGIKYLAPNVHRPGEPIQISGDEECHLSLEHRDQEAEIKWFMAAFEPELEKLRAAYDDVTVSWGLHVYWM